MSDVTLDKKAYKEVIREDIELVKKYIPKEHILRTHIIAVLKSSVDLQYPPEYWDTKICRNCLGTGISTNKINDLTIKCPGCNGKGKVKPNKKSEVFPEFPDEKPGYPSRRNAELP